MENKQTSEEIHLETVSLASEERRISIRVLENLRRIECSMYYAEIGYPDLYKYARAELKYSEYEAYNRIHAMWALKDLPESAKSSLASGEVNASTLSKLYNFSKRHSLTTAQKEELFEHIKGKSNKEVGRMFSGCSDDSEFEELFEKIKGLYSHKHPNAGLKELFVVLAKEKLCSVSVTERSCTYKDPKSGKVCGSKFFLEKDHIQPKSMGGTDESTNMRWFCRTHNQLAAVQKVGRPVMEKYINKLKA